MGDVVHAVFPVRKPVRLTFSSLDDIKRVTPPEHGKPPIYLTDVKPTGLVAYVTSGGVRSFLVRKKKDGKTFKRTLEKPVEGYRLLDDARKEARGFLNQLDDTGEIKRAVKTALVTDGTQPLDKITVKEAFAFAISNKITRKGEALRGHSVKNYQRALLVLEPWHDLPLFSITKMMVTKLHGAIRDRIDTPFSKRGKKRIGGPAAANNAMKEFAAVYNYCARRLEGDTPKMCPTLILGADNQWCPKKNEGPGRKIEPEHFKHWWDSMEEFGSLWCLYFRMMGLTGLRRTECRVIEWDWYDAETRTLAIPKKANKSGRLFLRPIGTRLAKLIEAHRATQADYPDHTYMFAKPDGRLIGDASQPLKTHREKYGHLYKWSPHDLRRVFGSVASDGYVPEPTIGKLLNHSSGTTTDGQFGKPGSKVTKLYTIPEHVRDHQEAMEAAIFKRAGYSPRR